MQIQFFIFLHFSHLLTNVQHVFYIYSPVSNIYFGILLLHYMCIRQVIATQVSLQIIFCVKNLI